MNRTLRLLGLAAALLSTPAPAQDAAERQSPPKPGPPRPFELPAHRSFQLDNGLQVTLIPYGTVPKATVVLAVQAGNLDEGPEQTWLSDMVADLMVEGSESRSASQIAEAAARMGGTLVPQVLPDESLFQLEVLSEFAGEAVGLIAEVVRRPAFPKAPLERLKADRLRDLSIARSQPQQLAMERFSRALYGEHPYGRVFPAPEVLEGFTVDAVRGFYLRTYGAARSHLYVAGRFDEQAVERALREHLSGWTRGTGRNALPPQVASERALHVLDRPGAVQSSLYLGLAVADPSSEEWVRLQVMNMLLGGYFSSRITSNIREDKGYTYSPRSTLVSHLGDAHWAQVADVTTDVTGPAIREILREIERLRTEAPSPAEVEGVKRFLVGNFVLQNSSRAGLISQLRFANLHGLGSRYVETFVQRVMAVTAEDVHQAARRHLRPDRLLVVVVGDSAKMGGQLEALGQPPR